MTTISGAHELGRGGPPQAADRAGARMPARLDLTVFDRISAAEPIWRELEAAGPASIHQTHDWCRAWADLPGARTRIVLVAVDGRPAMLLPLELVRRCGLTVAEPIATAHSNANGPLYAPDFPGSASPDLMRRIAARLCDRTIGADVLLFDKLRPSRGAYPEPLLHLPHVTSQNPSFQLPLLATFEETLRQINAKRRRKKFRVSERRLDAFGGYRHRIADTDAAARALLERFFQQKAARLRARGLPDVFAAPGIAAAFDRLSSFSGNGGRPVLRLHSIAVTVDGREEILAVAGLTDHRGHVTCQFGSIDDRIAPEASAGELLFFLMIEQAVREGATLFDFGVGDQPYKRSWCPVETEHADVILPLTPIGHAGAAALAAVVRTKRFVKTSPRLHAVARRLRALGAGSEPARTDEDD